MANAVTDAQKKLKAAQEALETAQSEARRAEAEAFARAVEDILKKAGHAIWEWRRALDFPDDETVAICNMHTDLQDKFANIAFNAKERVEALNKLDADRWHLDGKWGTNTHYFTEDNDVSYAIATWLFDCDVDKNPKDERYQALLVAAKRCVGNDIAEAGFQFYLEGRHDT